MHNLVLIVMSVAAALGTIALLQAIRGAHTCNSAHCRLSMLCLPTSQQVEPLQARRGDTRIAVKNGE